MRLLRFSIAILTVILWMGCEEAEPPEGGRYGDVVEFSGHTWDIKSSADLMGPGPNYFSDHPDDIWVDSKGYLHMRIASHDGIWYATELVSQDTVGYGTYVFTVESQLQEIDPNIVLGLFTWDNNSFFTQANSEIDIEFSKWGNPEDSNTLSYAVQPVSFGPYYPERVNSPDMDGSVWNGVSTHGFTWTDTLVTWESYAGENWREGELLASWSFDLNNPARVKNEGGNSSAAIIIPAPGETTNARINFWLLNGSAPTDQKEVEVVIRSFSYTPL